MLNKFILLSILGVVFTWNTLAAQDEPCGPGVIDEVESYYTIGKFELCISKLKNCLQKNGFGFSEKIQAYRFLSMSYLAIDSIDRADENIAKLLLLNDNFEPFSNDPYRFRIEVIYQRQLLRADLISSVSKKAENINLAPATIQIVTDKDIMLRGYQDLEAIFYDLPGFDISRDFGITFSTLYQRGYRSATMTERTLLLVDGIESNELWTNSAFLTKQFPVSRVKRVEVIYGPASTIYGANAFVGVINIVTKGEDDYFPAQRDELLGKRKTLAIDAITGYSSLNTRYVDVTIAKRGNKDSYFSLTGRIYKSDGFDLSQNYNWDGNIDYESSIYQSNFTIKNPSKDLIKSFLKADPSFKFFQISKDSTIISPTLEAINSATKLDNQGYKQTYKGVDPSKFNNPINDFYIAGKGRFGDFNIGFEFWNKNEGAVGLYIDRFASNNAELTNWQVRQYNIYVKYNKALSEKLTFDNFTYFRGSDFGDDSRVTSYRSYGNKALPFLDLVSSGGTKYGNFSTIYYAQTANIFRNEFKLEYKISEQIDLNSGSELKISNLQGDYVKGGIFPAIQYGVVTNGSTLKGGNNFNAYTISAFSQFNYHNPVKHFNASIAYHWDYNVIPKEEAGYGHIFNPRFAFVYYPGKTIFKLYYSEAFMDASAFNKFSISGSRLINNPQLHPEQVKNIEFSAHYNFEKSKPTNYIDISIYKAFYTSTLALINYTIPGTTTVTNRFDAQGKSEISGIQMSLNYKLNDLITFYGNLTQTNPFVILSSTVTHQDSLTIRTGDISSISTNLGLNISLLPKEKLNLNVRWNMVGAKPTGSKTSIVNNPLSEIPGFSIFHLNLGYQINQLFRAQIACTNLFNTDYFTPGVRVADNIQQAAIIPQYGRMFQIQLVCNLRN